MNSEKYLKVKDYYDRGLWSKTRVANAVVKGWITAEEYESITGDVYVEGSSDGLNATLAYVDDKFAELSEAIINA